MRITDVVEIRAIQEHLSVVGSGVLLDLTSMPGEPSEYKGFSARLDSEDVTRLILWWEFKKHTKDGSCRVVDALPTATAHRRVRSFIEGDPASGRSPVDLRTATGLEIAIVSDDLDKGILYIIDGGHRAIAQYFAQRPFQDVPVLACVHPKIRSWAYIPPQYKA